MPSGDKGKYTEKQKRKAEHIEDGYLERGVQKDEAERRAWATVNKQDGGGKKPGGAGRKDEAKNAKSDSSKARSEAARKGWETRRRNS